MGPKDPLFGAEPDRLEQLVRLALDADDADVEGTPRASEPVGELMERPGTRIGCYKLLRLLGEGGMGLVYLAEQEGTIRRQVALKVIKPGLDTKRVIARFESERQALALLDHPNIAKVFDAGATKTGRPYFVMELVTDVSITEYCDKNNLSTEDRLALFLLVCSAVQHAHQKGIIHRDIKPSNVMVITHDGKPVPKVIDFGVAKAINQRLTEKTLFTRYGRIIGTPAYMSPEQAELSDQDIDHRSDIYSLGVLLYELLTGTTPFSEEELRQAGYLEMQRIIREEEPVKPSTKLRALGETLTDIAKHRSCCTPDVLARSIRGDLDWIVMKALEKNRARRYEGASSLALDIERHLEHRPITAHAPSARHRLQKFLRRNRLQVGAVLAVVVVIVTIIISSVWNRYRVRHAEAEGVRQVHVLADADELVETAFFIDEGPVFELDTLVEAGKLVDGDNLPNARKILLPILTSKRVGLEARTLFATTLGYGQEADEAVEAAESIMNQHYQERVQYYTRKIQADPTDPNNYLWRAQQYQCLCDEENVYADMSRYATLLGHGWFSRLRFGPRVTLASVMKSPPCYRVVFSLRRQRGGIVATSIAVGGEGEARMKSLEIPMFLTSLLAPCLFPGIDVPPVYADFDLGQLINLRRPVPLINPACECINCFSMDGLEIYIESGRPGGEGWDIWVLRRSSIDDDWGPPENLGPSVNSPKGEAGASISSDGLTLYFNSSRPGGHGSSDIYMATRPTKSAPWSRAVNMGPGINSPAYDCSPWLSPNGLELYFTSKRLGGCGKLDIYVARRVTTEGPWDEPENLGPTVNSPYDETLPSLSPDGRILLFSEALLTDRPGGCGEGDIWMTRRASLSDPWQTPVNMGPKVNAFADEVAGRLSPDGSRLYFDAGCGNIWGNWQVSITPVIDFNGDGKVNGKDRGIMMEHWGRSDSMCDIGPYAWGDGVVDEQDLFVLAKYLEQDANDSTPVAHSALDEAEGTVACDNVGDKHATVAGEPTWQLSGSRDQTAR